MLGVGSPVLPGHILSRERGEGQVTRLDGELARRALAWSPAGRYSSCVSSNEEPEDDATARQFQAAAGEKAPSLLGEFTGWLAHNKKWWLAPVLVVTLLLGLVLVLQGTALGSWIYALL